MYKGVYYVYVKIYVKIVKQREETPNPGAVV